MTKSLIYYHRSYRKITRPRRLFLFQFLLVVVPITLIILIFYPEITKQMCLIARNILLPSFPPGALEIIQQTFLLNKDVYLLIGPESYPSTLTSFISSLVMLVLIFILQGVKIDKNIAIFATFSAVIHMSSTIYFTLVPYMFAYTFTDFAELYVKTIICIWLFIPCIMSMAILPLPASFFPKLFLIILTLIYSFIFTTLRYAIFLYILSKFSFIYMALLFFAFGPLIDFIYIVGIYAVYTTYLAQKLKANELVWKWLC